jgi:hypothetical protein
MSFLWIARRPDGRMATRFTCALSRMPTPRRVWQESSSLSWHDSGDESESHAKPLAYVQLACNGSVGVEDEPSEPNVGMNWVRLLFGFLGWFFKLMCVVYFIDGFEVEWVVVIVLIIEVTELLEEIAKAKVFLESTLKEVSEFILMLGSDERFFLGWLLSSRNWVPTLSLCIIRRNEKSSTVACPEWYQSIYFIIDLLLFFSFITPNSSFLIGILHFWSLSLSFFIIITIIILLIYLIF